MALYTLKNDYLFKRLLGVEENKPILQDLIECVLDLSLEKISGLEFLDKELKKEKMEEWTGILDVQVRLKDGTLIDIEIQAVWSSLFVERSFAYLNKMYTSTLRAGEVFSPAHRCIAINIIGKGYNINDEIHSVASFMDNKTHKVITEAIEMHFLNLEKVKSLPVQEGKSKAERLINWMKFIDTNKKGERSMIATTSPVLELLNEKIEEVTRSPEEQRRFDSRMKMRSDILGGFQAKFNEGMQQGIEEGMKEGAYQNKLETAKKLLKMKMPVKDVAEATGLKEYEVARLK